MEVAAATFPALRGASTSPADDVHLHVGVEQAVGVRNLPSGTGMSVSSRTLSSDVRGGCLWWCIWYVLSRLQERMEALTSP